MPLDYPSGVAAANNNMLYVTGFTDGLLGNLNGATTSAVDAWMTQLDKNTGRLLRVVGGNMGGVAQPGGIPTTDIGDLLVTADQLPAGDFRIQTTEGTQTGVTFFSYGRVATSLARIFNPNVPNSFPSVLGEQVRNGNIQI